MAYDPRYGEFVRELLAELGELRIRPMFGGDTPAFLARPTAPRPEED